MIIVQCGACKTRAEAGRSLSDAGKPMVWPTGRAHFPGFNTVCGAYCRDVPPTHSAVEVIAYKPEVD